MGSVEGEAIVNVEALVRDIASWAADQTGLHWKVRPLAEYFAEASNAMTKEVLIAVAKAIEAGIYLGKFGFPDERTELPDAFKGIVDEDGQ